MLLHSRTECRSRAVFLMQDRCTRRVCRIYGFTECPAMKPNVLYCVVGTVNNTDKRYRVKESVKRNTKYAWSSTAPPNLDGAEGSAVF
jgi:hypothetical protein